MIYHPADRQGGRIRNCNRHSREKDTALCCQHRFQLPSYGVFVYLLWERYGLFLMLLMSVARILFHVKCHSTDLYRGEEGSEGGGWMEDDGVVDNILVPVRPKRKDL